MHEVSRCVRLPGREPPKQASMFLTEKTGDFQIDPSVMSISHSFVFKHVNSNDYAYVIRLLKPIRG